MIFRKPWHVLTATAPPEAREDSGRASPSSLLLGDVEQRNGFMLNNEGLGRLGYDWWWHSLVGRSRSSGQKMAFFIEYYVVNPRLGGRVPILGQTLEHRSNGTKPSYAMLKAGSWAEGDSRQIHNFFGLDEFRADPYRMDVTIGTSTASDTHLKGQVSVSPQEACSRPELMSDAGEMSWDLQANKVLSYSAGFGTSWLFQQFNAFEMFWHVKGMKTQFTGEIRYNGEIFDVTPEDSSGYQDKNWGSDYTVPWIWVNCNSFTRRSSGEKLPMTSLDVGGGVPVIAGIPLGEKVLIALHHDGYLYEFNFSNIFKPHRQRFRVEDEGESLHWNVEAEDSAIRIVINFSEKKSRMLKMRYENPRGEIKLKNLWNGGGAKGTVELYRRDHGVWKLVDTLDGEWGGVEYGED